MFHNRTYAALFFFCCRVTPLDCETTPTGRLNVEKMAAGFKLERRETHVEWKRRYCFRVAGALALN